MSGKRKTFLFFIAAALAAGGAFFYFRGEGGGAKAEYETAAVTRGVIEDTVSSSGKLQAVGTVNVLTQLTGTVEKVLVDFNDTVTMGQPLVELNTEMLKISLREAEAALTRARAQYNHAKLLYDKNTPLFRRRVLSELDYHASKTEMEVQQAALIQAETQYGRARLNIDEYAIILSPIDGIVLDRKVEKGETVVANSGSVTQLFILAENLDTMEIMGEVDELDISSIRLGMQVRFTVEAYPDKNFTGEVSQIRKVPVTTDNVVNYTVIVTTQNPEGLLLPGMTANMEFLVMEKKDVLVIPTSVFRFNPPEDVALAARRKVFEESLAGKTPEEKAAALKQFDAEAESAASQAAGGGGLLGMRLPGRRGGRQAAAGSGAAEPRRTLWLLEADGFPRPHTVKTGIVDGVNTELLDAAEIEGRAVILREK